MKWFYLAIGSLLLSSSAAEANQQPPGEIIIIHDEGGDRRGLSPGDVRGRIGNGRGRGEGDGDSGGHGGDDTGAICEACQGDREECADKGDEAATLCMRDSRDLFERICQRRLRITKPACYVTDAFGNERTFVVDGWLFTRKTTACRELYFHRAGSGSARDYANWLTDGQKCVDDYMTSWVDTSGFNAGIEGSVGGNAGAPGVSASVGYNSGRSTSNNPVLGDQGCLNKASSIQNECVESIDPACTQNACFGAQRVMEYRLIDKQIKLVPVPEPVSYPVRSLVPMYRRN